MLDVLFTIDAIAKAFAIKYNAETGQYSSITGADFASGTIPTQPDGSPYSGCSADQCSPTSDNKSFAVSVNLDSGIYTRSSSPGLCSNLNSLQNGLVGYWDFNEGRGTMVTDRNGNNGTWRTTPNWVTGKMGTAIQFTANEDRISTNITDALNNNVHTIAFWINFQATDDTWRQILAYRPAVTDRSPGIWVTRGNLCFHWKYWPNNTGPGCAGPTGENSDFTVDTWYHIVGIKNGKDFTFYVNGQLKDSATVDNPETAGTAAIDFGKTDYSAAHIKIDEVRIYDRVLSPDEITASYNDNAGCSLY